MLFAKKPIFMENPDWYVEYSPLDDDYPENDRGLQLTDKAPQKAIDSYNAYYEMLESDDIAVKMSEKLSATAFGD